MGCQGVPGGRRLGARLHKYHTPPPSNQFRSYVRLLRRALDPRGAGRGLYFSHGADVTLTTQKWAALGQSPPPDLYARADPRFFWNKALATPLLESEMGAQRIAPFVVPCIQGFCGTLGPLALAPGPDGAAAAELEVTLIARRSPLRPGVRHWRRGADPRGATANYVETEQIAIVTTTAGPAAGAPTIAAFVLARGSIPLLWSQAPLLKYKPPTRVAPPSCSEAAFDRHFDSLLDEHSEARLGGGGGGAREECGSHFQLAWGQGGREVAPALLGARHLLQRTNPQHNSRPTPYTGGGDQPG